MRPCNTQQPLSPQTSLRQALRGLEHRRSRPRAKRGDPLGNGDGSSRGTHESNPAVREMDTATE
eukprot:11160048-Lingulodinium_polyedra.AAC.1